MELFHKVIGSMFFCAILRDRFNYNFFCTLYLFMIFQHNALNLMKKKILTDDYFFEIFNNNQIQECNANFVAHYYF